MLYIHYLVYIHLQVLSKTVADAMEFYGIPGTKETIGFVRMIDRAFDCLNGRNLMECKLRRKPDLRPYR